MSRYLLCTDLDRTLIPNGPSPLCPPAASLFRQLAAREELSLAYVTGRHRALIEDAIAEFELPCPDFAIADVGASIYEVSAQGWRPWRMWEEHIATDWRGMNSEGLRKLLRGLPELQLQEKEKQAPFKLSFYVRLNADSDTLTAMIRQRLLYEGIRANLISSVDELAGIGLLDVLPQSAGKLHAIRFLMKRHSFCLQNTIFAGDSGNDLDVLLSEIPAVLVANAAPEIKTQTAKTKPEALYIAKGGYLGMNGNYSAGILEGVAHFWPEADAWLREYKIHKDE
ncbi:MAG: HAD-IIB family hydrolase [Desulfomicrobium sp.]|nr:HAD-IIB family hydrolase [Pseudomonadota bacterium]MBV1712112.1 HAD-IIB family hydrolase [Desulfomicrobium sp.]MBU4572750.1 HAD-IIB family hydrolase [Pseudomonadota bacterium]MBU4594745.1 HAD-IIB family hydrolase [Pseudomonadota bacterium]MBV1718616.1 HAD-IIB family hydrolase [Desulfomicrobium sp.]